LFEQVGIGEGRLAVCDDQSKGEYFFAVVAASEYSQHVLTVLLGSLAHHAEG